MTDCETQIRENLEWSLESIERKLEAVETGSQDPRRAYSSLAIRERSIGVYHLLIDEPGDAKSWFTSSTEHECSAIDCYREYVKQRGSDTWENEPLKVREAFYTAILSQDEQVLETVVEHALAVPATYLDEFRHTRSWYDLAVALATFIRGDPEYQDHLADLRESAGRLKQTATRNYRGLATAIEGIDAGDTEQVAAGIAETIPLHEDENDMGSPNANALVCRPAAAMYALALMHGLDPNIDREYVPEVLDDSYIELHY